MTENVEQRYCIKFYQKLGDSKVETIWKIQQAFGDDAMGATQIKKWFNRFEDGRTLANSEQRSGRPSTSWNANVIENVCSLILEDRHLTVREIADEVGISIGCAHSILTEDLHMCRVVAKFVPKLLSQEQQKLCLEVVQDMLECANGDPEFLKTVITGDETWVYGYDPETKVQSSQWKHSSFPRPKKVQRVRCKVKGLPTAFFDYRGIVNRSYAPKSQTINKEYYLEVIHHLRDAVRRKRLDLWASRNWQLHHDNAPAHSSHLIQSFLAKHGIPVVHQAPHSPDMAPCDFWLFAKLKRPLKGSRFDSRKDITLNAMKELRSLPEMFPAVEGTLG
jgi:transposase